MDSAQGRSTVGAADHLAAASTARASGDLDAMHTALVATFDAARAAGDTEAMADAALAMPARHDELDEWLVANGTNGDAFTYLAYAPSGDVLVRGEGHVEQGEAFYRLAG
jgi:hypothetical protein